VHGEGGLDELSPSGTNLIVEVVDGDVREWELDPRTLGIYPGDLEELRGGSPADNAATMHAVFEGEKGVRRDAVLLNAAGALVTCELAGDLGEGIGLATDTIDSGAASERLGELVRFSAGTI
jgi:anthranilate phosphoribosyltransferase